MLLPRSTNPQVLSWLKHIFSTLVAYGFLLQNRFFSSRIRRGDRYDKYSSRAKHIGRALRRFERRSDRNASWSVVVHRWAPPLDSLMRCKFPCHYFDVYAFQSNKTHVSKMLTATPSLLYSHRRVSSDTSAHWDVMLMHKIAGIWRRAPCLKNALHFSITRSFLHRKWWLNDPDCVILPGTGLTSGEMILQLTICMSGGVVVISEGMPSLDLNNFALLKNTSNEPISVWPTEKCVAIDFQSCMSAVGATLLSAVHCLPL